MAAQRCPVELWTRICTYACTDDGRTGCALSLVSHFIHDVAQPHRYNSVALTRRASCRAFATLIESLPASPAVRHLLISVTAVGRGRNPVAHYEKMTALIKTSQRIVRAVAPSLCTLVLHSPGDILSPDIASLAFPRLTHLTVPELHSVRPQTQGHDFPCLRYLHVSSRFNDAWKKVPMYTPSLTHLRITKVLPTRVTGPFLYVLLDIASSAADSGSLPEIDEPYEPGSQEERDAVAVAQRLRTLEQIYVQPFEVSPPGPDDSDSDSDPGYGPMLNDLRTIARACADRSTKKMHLLPPTRGYSQREAMVQWLDVVQGGDGSWSEKAFMQSGDAPESQAYTRWLPALATRARPCVHIALLSSCVLILRAYVSQTGSEG